MPGADRSARFDAAAGALLSLGAPAGWLLLRVGRGEVDLGWDDLGAELTSHADLYLYLLLGTCSAFTIFGVILGDYADRLAQANAAAEERAIALDWQAACREMVADMKLAFERLPTFADRNVGIGRGAGGDNTLVVDEVAEDAVFAVLERLANEHEAAFTAISEERGTVEFGSEGVLVIVDPIDGSLNAKRVAQSYSLSLAVAVLHALLLLTAEAA